MVIRFHQPQRVSLSLSIVSIGMASSSCGTNSSAHSSCTRRRRDTVVQATASDTSQENSLTLPASSFLRMIFRGAAPSYSWYASRMLDDSVVRPFSLVRRRTALCEPAIWRNEKDGSLNTAMPDDQERAKLRAELDRLRALHQDDNDDASCPSCLYVGVATSLGLAAYFAHAAFEEDHQPKQKLLSQVARKQQQQLRYNKPVFLAISMAWMGIGAYRWHLG